MAKQGQSKKKNTVRPPPSRPWFPKAVRACIWSVLIVSILWAAGVLSRPEKLIQVYLIDLLTPQLQTWLAGEIAIILADENPQKNGELKAFNETWRRHHAELVDALAKARTRVVAFDLSFPDPASGDAEFARAIRRAASTGARVILGAEGFDVREGYPAPHISTDLRPQLTSSQWALLSVGGKNQDTGLLRRMEVARRISAPNANGLAAIESHVVPSLALQVAAQYRGWGETVEIALAEGNQIHVKATDGRALASVQVSPDVDIPVEMATAGDLSRITRPYHLVWSNRANTAYLEDNFKDKIVLVAYKTSEDVHPVAGGKTRYGYEVHASVISSLLLGNYVRPAQPPIQWLAIVAMSLAATVLHLRFPRATEKRVSLPALHWIQIQMSLCLMTVVLGLIYLAAALVLYQSRRLVLEFSLPAGRSHPH